MDESSKRILTTVCVTTIILGSLMTTVSWSHDIDIKPHTPPGEVFMRQRVIVPVEEKKPVRAVVATNNWSQDPYYWDDLLAQYDWPLNVARAVMLAESGGDPNAENWKDYHPTADCYGSFGLFQLACFRGTTEDLKDPETNVERAYLLWKATGGWSHWGAYTDGRYLKYML